MLDHNKQHSEAIDAYGKAFNLAPKDTDAWNNLLYQLSMEDGKVHLTLEIYKTIIASSTRYANPRINREDWAEVYGLLYGYNQDDDVHITEAVPFTHTVEKSDFLNVAFDEEDYALAAEIESQMSDRTPQQFIVGWFHSHPGIMLSLSQLDVKTQLAWQTNNPKAIALVFNPTRLASQGEVAKKDEEIQPLKNDLGFLCLRLNDPSKVMEANFHKVPFDFTDVDIDDTLIENVARISWAGQPNHFFPGGDF